MCTIKNLLLVTVCLIIIIPVSLFECPASDLTSSFPLQMASTWASPCWCLIGAVSSTKNRWTCARVTCTGTTLQSRWRKPTHQCFSPHCSQSFEGGAGFWRKSAMAEMKGVLPHLMGIPVKGFVCFTTAVKEDWGFNLLLKIGSNPHLCSQAGVHYWNNCTYKQLKWVFSAVDRPCEDRRHQR